MAAKTVMEAVDAATAPSRAATDPDSAYARRGRPPSATQPQNHRTETARSGDRMPTPPRLTRGGLQKGSRRFGAAMWAPLARLSGVLWLEVSGVFFGLFALSAAVGAWRLHAAWHRTPVNGTEHSHMLLSSAVAVLFGYFCASSFLRARQRGRRA